MEKVFQVTMLIMQGLLAAGCFVLAALESGTGIRILYVLAGLLLVPVVPLRKKAEEKFHLNSFLIPAAGILLLIGAIMLTPIH